MPNEPQVIDVADALSHDDCDSILGKQYLSKNSISQRLQNESLTIPHYG